MTETKGPLRILRFEAENIKKLRCVEVTPDGAVVQITGANGSGKSSLLDSIWWALGGERVVDAEPLRRGTKKGSVTLDLGEFVVTRRFTEGGSALVVENKSGMRYNSPQRLLDGLLGQLTFDPLAFARMAPKEQLNQLRSLLSQDALRLVEEAEYRMRASFDKRTDKNRQVRSLGERLEQLDKEIDPGQDVTLVDTKALLEAIGNAAKVNGVRQEQIRFFNDQDRDLATHDETLTRLEHQMAEVRRQRDILLQQIADRAPLVEAVDTTELTQKVQDGTEINNARLKQLQVRDMWKRIKVDLEAAKEESDKLSADIEEAQTVKAKTIAGAALPVPGLSFTDEGVTLNEIPFAQASSAEQLRVSVALAMAANPQLRILRVKDGSLLDEKSLKLLTDMVDARGYQCWVESVDTSGKVGVYLEDGAVAAINGVRVAQETATT